MGKEFRVASHKSPMMNHECTSIEQGRTRGETSQEAAWILEVKTGLRASFERDYYLPEFTQSLMVYSVSSSCNSFEAESYLYPRDLRGTL